MRSFTEARLQLSGEALWFGNRIFDVLRRADSCVCDRTFPALSEHSKYHRRMREAMKEIGNDEAVVVGMGRRLMMEHVIGNVR